MEYVVFDLEWNQCPYGKQREVKRLPFEIIEIGAVKLDKNREIIDRFRCVVRPVIYRTLHHRTREIVHLDKAALEAGLPFAEAIRQFLSWAGPEAKFCTWGTVDLIELQRNMKFYGMLDLLKGPLYYLDVQKLFAVAYETMTSRRSLEYGIDYLKIEKNEDFHRALSDAIYTAKVLQRIDMDIILAYDSLDVYQNPKCKEEEIHAVYNGYSSYVSREFETKEEAMNDREVISTHCCLCGKNARKRIRWFSVGAKNYYGVSACPVHGFMRGHIRMKHNDEGKYFVIKTIKVSSELEMESIRSRKEFLREKRRKKTRKTVRSGDTNRKDAENHVSKS